MKRNINKNYQKLAERNIEVSGWQQKKTFQLIFMSVVVILMIMPFITTFNEFLTRIVEKIHLYYLLESRVVPYLSKLVGVVLKPFGLSIIATDRGLFLPAKNLWIEIAWNCIGWQSMILIIVSLVTGLQGYYSRFSKIETILIGILGTFLLNIFRIASVVLVAIAFGYFPAVIYHDYFSNLLIILWLFLFWWLAYAFVLEPVIPKDEQKIAKRHSFVPILKLRWRESKPDKKIGRKK